MEKLGLLAVCNSEEENALKTWYYFPSMNKRGIKKYQRV